MKQRIVFLLPVLLLFGLLLSGCAQSSELAAPARVGSVQNDKIEKTSSGEDQIFIISVDQAMHDSGQPVSIWTSGKIQAGELHIVLRDPQGNVAWDPGGFGGEFSANTFYKPTQVGEYHLGTAWVNSTRGSYNLSYQADHVSPLALFPGAGMMLVAVVFIVYALRKRSGSLAGTWGYMALGALAWTVTVVIKFAIAIPLNSPVYQAIYVPDQLWAPGSVLFYIYVGALTGLTEVLLTWLLLRYTRLGKVTWGRVLAFGVGFGAFEALLLGFSNLASALIGLASPQHLPANALAGLIQANSLLFGSAPIVERIATVFCHILANALLFYGVARGQARWLWVSFAFKTLLDTVAAFAQLWGVGTLPRIWAIEAIIVLFGIASWWAIRAISRRYPGPSTELPVPAAG